jgi:hypothetical protein
MHAIIQVEEEHHDEYLPPQKSRKRTSRSSNDSNKRPTSASNGVFDQVGAFVCAIVVMTLHACKRANTGTGNSNDVGIAQEPQQCSV